jgi:hypothetical protein
MQVKARSRDGRWTLEVTVRDGVELIRVCYPGINEADVRRVSDLPWLAFPRAGDFL